MTMTLRQNFEASAISMASAIVGRPLRIEQILRVNLDEVENVDQSIAMAHIVQAARILYEETWKPLKDVGEALSLAGIWFEGPRFGQLEGYDDYVFLRDSMTGVLFTLRFPEARARLNDAQARELKNGEETVNWPCIPEGAESGEECWRLMSHPDDR